MTGEERTQIEEYKRLQACMMHEVKTPLLCISSVLRDMVGKQEADFETLAMCERALKQLADHIEASLRMMDESHNFVDWKVEAIEMNAFRKYLYQFFGPMAGEKDIALDIKMHNEAFTYLYLPRVTIMHILGNLMTNAVKFTDPGGRIELHFDVQRIEECRAKLRITVTDNGSGMESGRTDMPGNGLGLSCVRVMLEAIRGRMTTASKKERGTQVCIDLEVDGSDEKYGCLESKCGRTDAPAALAADRVQGNNRQELLAMKQKYKGRKVLVAEDDELFMEWIESALGKYGIYADKTYDGEEAVDLFQDSSIGEYQAVLMDVGLPGRDGREAAHIIRQMEREDAELVPILAFTGMPIEDEDAFLEQTGMTGIVPKIFEEENLIGILDRLWVSMNENPKGHTK